MQQNNVTNITFVRYSTPEETRDAIRVNNEILQTANKPSSQAPELSVEECEAARIRNREALALMNSTTSPSQSGKNTPRRPKKN